MKKAATTVLKRALALFFIVTLLFNFNVGESSAAVLKAGLKGTAAALYLGKSADGRYFIDQDHPSSKVLKYAVKFGGTRYIGYCMEPGKGFYSDIKYSSGKYASAAAWKALSAAKQELLALVMLYGYSPGVSSPSGNGNDYYEATQVLIWETVYGDVKLNSGKRGIVTDRKHNRYNRIKGRKYAVNCYNQIKKDINAHLKGASFAARSKASAKTYVMKYDYKAKKFKTALTDSNYKTSKGQKLISGSSSGLSMSRRSSSGSYTFNAAGAGTYTGVLGNDVKARTSQPLLVLKPSTSSMQSVILGAADETAFYVKMRTEKAGKVKLTKTSPDGNVGGFSFRLTCAANGYDKTLKTNASGQISASLYPGTYKWSEALTAAQKKAGYSQKSGSVTVKEGKTAEVKVANSRHTVTARIVKTSDNGTREGFSFRIKGNAANMTAYDRTFVTNREGVITADLYPGKYTVTEILTKAQQEEGFVPADPQTFDITASTKDPYVINVHNRVEKPSGLRIFKEIEGKDEENLSGFRFLVRGVSEYETVDAEFLKSKINPVPVDGNVQMTSFEIYAEDIEELNRAIARGREGRYGLSCGLQLSGSQRREELKVFVDLRRQGAKVSDVPREAGGIRYSDPGLARAAKVFEREVVTDRTGRADIEDISRGTYTVREILNEEQKKLYCQPQEKTVNIEDDSNIVAFLHVTNVRRTKSARLIKTSTDPEDNVAGITFLLAGKTLAGEKIGPDKLVTGGDGSVDFTLYPGSYTISEENLDTGRYEDPGTMEFSITPEDCDEEKVLELNFINRPYAPVKIIKVDEDTGEPLEGASLQVLDSETERIMDEWVSAGEPHEVGGLSYGENYLLRETEAPDGYGLMDDKEFTAGEEETVTAGDPRTLLEVLKIDAQTEEPLEGAEFILKEEESGEEAASFTTGEDGRYTVSGLAEGREYVLSEIEPPQGYTAAEDRAFTFRDGMEIVCENDKPQISTEAFSVMTGTHMAPGEGTVEITDEVTMENLQPGQEYSLYGKLVDKDTGSKLAQSRETVFVAEADSGSAEVDFSFEAEGMAGKDTVIYEELRKDGKVVAVHEDIQSAEQTILFPELATHASEKGTGRKYVSGGTAVVADRVDYRNIEKGREYTVKGELVDKKSGDAVTEAEKNFRARETEGSVSLDFRLSPRPGENYVVFEDLYVKDDGGDLRLVASHRDPRDRGQSVYTSIPFKTGDTDGLFPYIIVIVTGLGILVLAVFRKWLTKE